MEDRYQQQILLAHLRNTRKIVSQGGTSAERKLALLEDLLRGWIGESGTPMNRSAFSETVTAEIRLLLEALS